MINVFKLEAVESQLNERMSEFEKSFSYPLGDSGTFTISHGDDYGRFFRAIGKSRVYVACSGDEVIGSLAVVQRPVMINGCQQPSIYIGDLKIKKGEGRVLYCLIKEAHDDNIEMRDRPHYGVMMKGTARRPSDYTGRLGLPKFKNMGEVAIMRVPVCEQKSKGNLLQIGLSGAISLSRELSFNGNILPIGRSNIRSQQTPTGYCLNDKSAVCIMEDTLSAKRLYSDDGSEIISGHLSSLQYNKPEEGVRLVNAVMPQAVENNYPALFFSVPIQDAPVFQKAFKESCCAPAFIYGRNMEAASRWQLNSSEI